MCRGRGARERLGCLATQTAQFRDRTTTAGERSRAPHSRRRAPPVGRRLVLARSRCGSGKRAATCVEMPGTRLDGVCRPAPGTEPINCRAAASSWFNNCGAAGRFSHHRASMASICRTASGVSATSIIGAASDRAHPGQERIAPAAHPANHARWMHRARRVRLRRDHPLHRRPPDPEPFLRAEKSARPGRGGRSSPMRAALSFTRPTQHARTS